MKFNIYHTLTLAHPFEGPASRAEVLRGSVGLLHVPDLDLAYELVVLLSRARQFNNTTTMSKADRIRSTSVGDIAVAEDGTAHRFEMVGTSKVDFTLPTLEGRQEDGLKKFSGLNFFF